MSPRESLEQSAEKSLECFLDVVGSRGFSSSLGSLENRVEPSPSSPSDLRRQATPHDQDWGNGAKVGTRDPGSNGAGSGSEDPTKRDFRKAGGAQQAAGSCGRRRAKGE